MKKPWEEIAERAIANREAYEAKHGAEPAPNSPEDVGKFEARAKPGSLVTPPPGPVVKHTPLLKGKVTPLESPDGWLDMAHLEPEGWGLGPGDNLAFDLVRSQGGQPVSRLWGCSGKSLGFGTAADFKFFADDAGVAFLRQEIAPARVCLCRSLREMIAAVLWLAKAPLKQRQDEGLAPVLAINSSHEILADVERPKGLVWLVNDRTLQGYLEDDLWAKTARGGWDV